MRQHNLSSLSVHRGITYLSVVIGIGVIGQQLLMARSLLPQYANTQQQIAAVENRAKFTEAKAKNHVFQADIFLIPGYKKASPKPPLVNVAEADRVLDSPVKTVVDEDGQCVGAIIDGNFRFWRHYKGVCESSWIDQELEKRITGA